MGKDFSKFSQTTKYPNLSYPELKLNTDMTQTLFELNFIFMNNLLQIGNPNCSFCVKFKSDTILDLKRNEKEYENCSIFPAQ